MTSTLAKVALTAGAAVTAAAALQTAPGLVGIGPLRRRVWPGLAGSGDPGHIALTFDDGPDPESTPLFLDMLAEQKVHATFFVLGWRLEKYPDIGKAIIAGGHELAVHGWIHRLLYKFGPVKTTRHLAHAADVVNQVGGYRPRWFRPPFGAHSAFAEVAARRAGMQSVLWTCWGKDWTSYATPDTVKGLVTRGIQPGGTILLHDTPSPTAAPGSWRSTLGAAPRIIDYCRSRGLAVGPLHEHGLRLR